VPERGGKKKAPAAVGGNKDLVAKYQHPDFPYHEEGKGLARDQKALIRQENKAFPFSKKAITHGS